MRRVAIVIAIVTGLLAGIVSVTTPGILAQSTPQRKVTERVAPRYPELAKRMHIEGAVRIEAVVRPNGSVKSTRVLGGSPVLVQPAIEAVQKWKFEVSQNETTETVQVTFTGQ